MSHLTLWHASCQRGPGGPCFQVPSGGHSKSSSSASAEADFSSPPVRLAPRQSALAAAGVRVNLAGGLRGHLHGPQWARYVGQVPWCPHTFPLQRALAAAQRSAVLGRGYPTAMPARSRPIQVALPRASAITAVTSLGIRLHGDCGAGRYGTHESQMRKHVPTHASAAQARPAGSHVTSRLLLSRNQGPWEPETRRAAVAC